MRHPMGGFFFVHIGARSSFQFLFFFRSKRFAHSSPFPFLVVFCRKQYKGWGFFLEKKIVVITISQHHMVYP